MAFRPIFGLAHLPLRLPKLKKERSAITSSGGRRYNMPSAAPITVNFPLDTYHMR